MSQSNDRTITKLIRLIPLPPLARLTSLDLMASPGSLASGVAEAEGTGTGGATACTAADSGTCAESELDVSAEAGRGGGVARRTGGVGTPARERKKMS